jgi:hypothetical protein
MIISVARRDDLSFATTKWPSDSIKFHGCSGRIGREIEANGIDRWLKEMDEECAFLGRNTHGSAIRELVGRGFTEEAARCWADRSYC